jgi:hypothetical protein
MFPGSRVRTYIHIGMLEKNSETLTISVTNCSYSLPRVTHGGDSIPSTAATPLPPPRHTTSKTRRAGKEGGGVTLVHSSGGGRPGQGEELSRRGGGDGWIHTGGHPSVAMRSVCPSPSSSPPPPTPCCWGPRSRV